MRIGFFLQNNKKGGLDTFLINLITHWNDNDDLILFCNQSHPGRNEITNSLDNYARVIKYDLIISEDLDFRLQKLPKILRIFVKIQFWFFGFFYQKYYLKKMFIKHQIDRLLIINGGYPGGDACLAASVAWNDINPNNKAWMNFHNFVVPEPTNILKRIKSRFIDYHVTQSTEGFVSVSHNCMNSLTNRNILSKVKKKFIYNGFSPLKTNKSSSIRKELGLRDDDQIILMLAVYEPRKGHRFIFQVMEQIMLKFSNAYLLLCGYGSEEEIENVDKIRQSVMFKEKIIMQPHRDDVVNLLSQVEILVMPSQSFESFGYTALEAMSCGVPVVVTNVGGLPEVVEDGKCGYVIQKNDIQGFAKSVNQLLEDKDLRKRMGEAGIKRYNNYFNVSQMVEKYERLIKD